MNTRSAAALLGAASLIGALATGPASPAQADPATEPWVCTQLNDQGDRVWDDTVPSFEMDSVAQQLSAQVDKHPDELMGVAFCHDYSAIELSVKDGVDLKQLPDVAKILSDNPASRVVIQTTPMSVAELRALRDSVVEADLADGTASAASYAIDTHDSTVVVSSQRGAQDTSLKKLKDVGQSGRVKIRDEQSKGPRDRFSPH